MRLFDVSNEKEQRQLLEVQWSRIQPSQLNPRKHFETESLIDLREDIRLNGLLEPLIVRTGVSGNDYAVEEDRTYEIVAGERRYRALGGIEEYRSGSKLVPVIWTPSLYGNDRGSFRVAVTENLERESLTPFEETLALLQLFLFELWPERARPATFAELVTAGDFLKKWVTRVESSRPQLADGLNRTVADVDRAVERTFRAREGLKVRSFVNNRLPLLRMPEDLQTALRSGRFPYNAAKEVAKVKDAEVRSRLIEAAASGMSYRTLITQAKAAASPPKEEASAADARLQEHAKEVIRLLQKMPKLSHNQRTKLEAAFTRIVETLE